MARITVEDCIDKFPSRFELVLVASQRARKLHSGDEPTVEKDNDKNTVVALREIADSAITVETMKENLIQEYQTVTINDEEDENLEIELSNSNEDNLGEKKLSEVSGSSNEAEKEISNLISAEESELSEQYEIVDNQENNIDSVNEDDNQENNIDSVNEDDNQEIPIIEDDNLNKGSLE